MLQTPSLPSIVTEALALRKVVRREPEQEQCDRGRRRLDVQNSAAHRQGAVDACDHYAEQKERLDFEAESLGALNQSPDKPCCQKTVIEALIGRKYRRLRRLLDRVVKCLQADRLGPKKHLQNQKIQMECGNHPDQQIGHPKHVPSPPAPTRQLEPVMGEWLGQSGKAIRLPVAPRPHLAPVNGSARS